MFSLLSWRQNPNKMQHTGETEEERSEVLTRFIFYDNWRCDGRDSGEEKEKESRSSFLNWCYLKEINTKHFRSHWVSLKKLYISMAAVLKDQAYCWFVFPGWLQILLTGRIWHQLFALHDLNQGSSQLPAGKEVLTCDLDTSHLRWELAE